METFGLRKMTKRKTNSCVTIYFDDFGCMAVHIPSGQYAFGNTARDTYANLLRTLGRDGFRRPQGKQWYVYQNFGRFLGKIDRF